MKKGIYSLLLALQLILFSSCSSLEGDAKEAARLNTKSLYYLDEGDLENSEKTFKESQEIVDKYRNTDKFDQFFKLYSEAMGNGGNKSAN